MGGGVISTHHPLQTRFLPCSGVLPLLYPPPPVASILSLYPVPFISSLIYLYYTSSVIWIKYKNGKKCLVASVLLRI
jgi:hypothetical protein